jgi:tetratricopeptide (TPR) repeat protein
VLAHAVGDPEIVRNSEINLAANWLALGEPDRARAYLEPIQEALASPGDPWMRWRYSLHALDVAGRLALVAGRPDEALAHAADETAGARRHRVTKVEARALVLRGEALLAMDRRADAEAALSEAVTIADGIAYPRAAWAALGVMAELKRREGAATDAERHASRRRALVAEAARSLGDAELRAALEATQSGPTA